MRLLRILKFLSLFALGLSSLSVLAEPTDSYKGPKLKWKERDVKAADVKKDKWDTNFQYRVQEKPYNRRGIASDPESEKSDVKPMKSKDMNGRDPSSLVDPLKYEFQDDVKQWKWKEKQK